jgi:hypothetical protein
MTTKRIHDNGIDRDMTAAEKAAHDEVAQELQTHAAATAVAADAKAAALASARTKLAAFGLTDDEVDALFGWLWRANQLTDHVDR